MKRFLKQCARWSWFIIWELSVACVIAYLMFSNPKQNAISQVIVLVTYFWVAVAALIVVGFFLVTFFFSIALLWYSLSRKKLRLAQLQQLSQLSYGNTDDFVGYRFARLVFDGDKVRFGSMTRDEHYFGVSSVATCGESHVVPDEACSCGYYSVQSTYFLRPYLDRWLAPLCVLKVQNSGKVIEGERGFRAHRQDVLVCFLPSKCRVGFCKRPVVSWQVQGSIRTPVNLAPVCAKHAYPSLSFSIQELRSQLQTDVEVV